jgi:hypothetical protein
VTSRNTSNPEGFMLALSLLGMIETAFCVVQSLSFGTARSQGLRKSQFKSAPMARAQIG